MFNVLSAAAIVALSICPAPEVTPESTPTGPVVTASPSVSAPATPGASESPKPAPSESESVPAPKPESTTPAPKPTESAKPESPKPSEPAKPGQKPSVPEGGDNELSPLDRPLSEVFKHCDGTAIIGEPCWSEDFGAAIWVWEDGSVTEAYDNGGMVTFPPAPGVTGCDLRPASPQCSAETPAPTEPESPETTAPETSTPAPEADTKPSVTESASERPVVTAGTPVPSETGSAATVAAGKPGALADTGAGSSLLYYGAAALGAMIAGGFLILRARRH